MTEPTQAHPGTAVAAPVRKLNLEAIEATKHGGGAMFLPSTMQECVDFASIMSRSDFAIPPKFRNNPGACLAITIQASRWQADPFGVIQKAYVVKAQDGSERIAYEAQLVAAVVNTRANLAGRLELIYSGTGGGRMVKVIGTFADTGEKRDVETPPVSKCKKKSPLWDADPDQQLAYYGMRAWGRRWCPEVLLGIYTPEEVREEAIVDAPRPVRTDHAITSEPANASTEETGIIRAAEPEPVVQAGESVDELIPVRDDEPATAEPPPPLSSEDAQVIDQTRVEPGEGHEVRGADDEPSDEDRAHDEALDGWEAYLIRAKDGLLASDLKTEQDMDDYANATKAALAAADGITEDEKDDLRARFVSAFLNAKRDRGFGRTRR